MFIKFLNVLGGIADFLFLTAFVVTTMVCLFSHETPFILFRLIGATGFLWLFNLYVSNWRDTSVAKTTKKAAKKPAKKNG